MVKCRQACALEYGTRDCFVEQQCSQLPQGVEKDCAARAARKVQAAALAIGVQTLDDPGDPRREPVPAWQQRHAVEVAAQHLLFCSAAEQSARPAPPTTARSHCRRKPQERRCCEARRPALHLLAKAACERGATALAVLQHEMQEMRALLDVAAPSSFVARQPCAARCDAAPAPDGSHQLPRQMPAARRRWL